MGVKMGQIKKYVAMFLVTLGLCASGSAYASVCLAVVDSSNALQATAILQGYSFDSDQAKLVVQDNQQVQVVDDNQKQSPYFVISSSGPAAYSISIAKSAAHKFTWLDHVSYYPTKKSPDGNKVCDVDGAALYKYTSSISSKGAAGTDPIVDRSQIVEQHNTPISLNATLEKISSPTTLSIMKYSGFSDAPAALDKDVTFEVDQQGRVLETLPCKDFGAPNSICHTNLHDFDKSKPVTIKITGLKIDGVPQTGSLEGFVQFAGASSADKDQITLNGAQPSLKEYQYGVTMSQAAAAKS